MVDVNTQFGGFLTALGAAQDANSKALGIPWKLTHMLIGDANGADPVPAPGQTALVNQVYRAQLNQLYVSPVDANVLIAELVLPPNIGGWWIRELALEDEDGVFSAVANCAPSYKPVLAQGSGRNQVVRMHVITSGTANIQLKIDPSVVLATRKYVDDLTVRATKGDAEDGTDNTKIMTPLRVWQAITKRFSTKEQAEAGEDNSTAMTPLRVFQALRSAAAIATEALRGVLRVGTQAEVNEGASDEVAVTPKKLRWGFSASFTANGYIVFPSWLGSLVIQWGTPSGASTGASGTEAVSFPIEFPTGVFFVIPTDAASNVATLNVLGAGSLSKTGFTAYWRVDSGSSAPGVGLFYYLAIGH
ncbi:phage tail protein [Stutzerimonas stutzeri]|uniref:phage tail protein n=1 Tax=Stutzerimonas stutzeri TaxID=316 RepID=UPI0026590DFC|nr:phage tail protein [Stutzerimonas stutzeri]MCF6782588.1 phage tail protein [Stutzerimonas stutzeri]MCF6805693.1 phage tail protein [Stutzerimonas stutzeri]